MSVLFSQNRLLWLAGAICLCLVFGCAGSGSPRLRSRTTESLPYYESAHESNTTACQNELSQESFLDERRAGYAETHDNQSSAKSADSGIEEAVLPTSSPGNVFDSKVTSTAWQSSEAALPEDESDESAGPLILEVLPPPDDSESLHSLSLREAIDTALFQNPDAVIARSGGPVANAARSVAATYPWNPQFQVQVDPYTRDLTGDMLKTKNQVTVKQPIEIAHQTRYRQRAADAGWCQQRAVIAQSELTAVVAAMRAYFDTLYRKSLFDLANRSASLQEKLVKVVERRFAAGIATPTDRIAARVAARQSQRQAELANAAYQTSLNSLRVVLNLSSENGTEPEGSLDAYGWLSVAEALEQPFTSEDNDAPTEWDDDTLLSVSNRPDVVAAGCAVSVARANLELAKANRIPNIATGPNYERDESGTLFFGVAAQVDLPIWNTGCPLVRQRFAELRQSRITWRQTKTRATLQAQAAVNRYQIAYKMWKEQQAGQDLSGQELETIAKAFEQGQASIVEVLSTQNSLIQEHQNYLMMLNELNQAAADLVSALAIDPERLVKSPQSDDPAGSTE